MVNPAALLIRAKKLGVMIKDARLAAGKSLEETAQYIGLSVDDYDACEMGDKSPSLPELELLAYFLDVTPEHFWGEDSLLTRHQEKKTLQAKKRIGLRQRVVGLLLRQARLSAGLTLEELAEKIGLPAQRLEGYELGELPVPLPDLEALTTLLDSPLQGFRDQAGPLATWMVQQQAVNDFKTLSPELQKFISKPVNRPYLELAQRLSEMNVDKLRAVAEGLLEITL